MAKKLFISVLLIFVVLFGVFADISVAVDNSSSYTPTQIINGSFDTEPWMTFTYNNQTYTSCPLTAQPASSSEYPISGVNVSNIIFNGVDAGWNTTDYTTSWANLFEYASDKYHNYSVSHNNFWYNTNIPYSDRFVEMNGAHAAVFYQDLTTHDGDVIKWTLKHAITVTGGDENQSMRVEIGAPQYNGNTIINASGTGTAIDSKIQSNSLAVFSSTGVRDSSGNTSEIGFAGSNIGNLLLKKSTQSDGWYQASGVYIIPDNQSVTRFAFASEANTPTVGNLLDDITFSTLIGNLHAKANTDGSITITGYWGETDEDKKLVVKSGSKENYIDMTTVCENNFVITISKDYIDSTSSVVDIYHQDYQSANKTVHVHKWVYIAGVQELFAYCSNTECADQCSYQGLSNAVSTKLVSNKVDLDVALEPSNISEDSVVWSSSDETVATVDDNGYVKSIKKGTAVITAKLINGSNESDSATITVLGTCKVTFSAGSGGSGGAVYYVPEGSRLGDNVKSFPTATKSLSVFNGWCKDGNSMSADDVITSDTTYTASWLKLCKVTFSAGSGASGGGSYYVLENTKLGDTVSTFPTATKSLSVFNGWYNGSNAASADDVITSDTTYTAAWLKLYTVTFSAGSGASGGGSYYVLENTKLGDTVTSFPTAIKSGSIFGGWYNGTDQASADDVITSNKTYSAKWHNSLVLELDEVTNTTPTTYEQAGMRFDLPNGSNPAELAIHEGAVITLIEQDSKYRLKIDDHGTVTYADIYYLTSEGFPGVHVNRWEAFSTYNYDLGLCRYPVYDTLTSVNQSITVQSNSPGVALWLYKMYPERWEFSEIKNYV